MVHRRGLPGVERRGHSELQDRFPASVRLYLTGHVGGWPVSLSDPQVGEAGGTACPRGLGTEGRIPGPWVGEVSGSGRRVARQSGDSQLAARPRAGSPVPGLSRLLQLPGGSARPQGAEWPVAERGNRGRPRGCLCSGACLRQSRGAQAGVWPGPGRRAAAVLSGSSCGGRGSRAQTVLITAR